MWYWKVWFDLIWFDLTRHSKSHWKQHSVWRRFILLNCWFASNKYFSISFSFSHFRCSCSCKSHSSKASVFVKLENTAFLSLAERIIIKSSSAVVEIVIVWLQPISTIRPIQSRESFIQFDKCEKSHFSFIHSFSSFTNNWEYGLPWAGYS